jgi:hypothetical protein
VQDVDHELGVDIDKQQCSAGWVLAFGLIATIAALFTQVTS